MKKIIGFIWLLVSIVWCLLMIPAFTYFAFDFSIEILLSKPEVTIANIGITFSGIVISVLIAFMVTKFGIGLINSSWQLITGKEFNRLTIRERIELSKT